MENKLSLLDKRLHEISTKIVLSTSVQTKQPEAVREISHEKPQIKKIEARTEIQKDKLQTLLPPIENSTPQRHRSVELSTLTEITNKIPEFPVELIKPSSVEANQILEDAIKAK